MKNQTKARVLWRLLIATALLVVPVVILLPLGYYWRKDLQMTKYASHYKSIMTYAWIMVGMVLVAVAVPWVPVSIAVLAIGVCIVLFVGVEGLRNAIRGVRHTDPIF